MYSSIEQMGGIGHFENISEILVGNEYPILLQNIKGTSEHPPD
jgi:hypothetical protein